MEDMRFKKGDLVKCSYRNFKNLKKNIVREVVKAKYGEITLIGDDGEEVKVVGGYFKFFTKVENPNQATVKQSEPVIVSNLFENGLNESEPVKKDSDDKCVKCGGHVEFSQFLNTCQICIHQENLRKKREREKEVAKQDMVNHPSHYTSDPSGIECIEITRHRNFNIGNAIKYLWRAGLKDSDNEVQDLEKAIWYIKDEIKRLERGLCQ